MAGTSPPFEERRHDDKLANYRMDKIEQQLDALQSKLDLNYEKTADQFALLRKELFERPVFVTLELYKLEIEQMAANNTRLERELTLAITRLEGKDNELAESMRTSLENISNNSISSRRFTATVVISVVSVMIAFTALWFRT